MSPSVHAASAGAAVLVKRAASSNGFYNNVCVGRVCLPQLFYILIAVLGAFVFTAVVNFLRTRRRRRLVFAEAARLDLMVPGLPGYVPMRERPALVKADGWRTPSWWEVVAGRSRGVVAQDSTHSQSASQPLTGGRAPLAPHSTEAYGADGDLEVTDLAQLVSTAYPAYPAPARPRTPPARDHRTAQASVSAQVLPKLRLIPKVRTYTQAPALRALGPRRVRLHRRRAGGRARRRAHAAAADDQGSNSTGRGRRRRRHGRVGRRRDRRRHLDGHEG